jgi:hypothetical protein
MIRRTIGALSAFWLLTVALGEPLLSRPTLVFDRVAGVAPERSTLAHRRCPSRPLCLSAGAHSGRRLSAYRDPADFAGWCARAAAVSSTAGGDSGSHRHRQRAYGGHLLQRGRGAISLPMQPMWRSCWNRLGIAPSAYWMVGFEKWQAENRPITQQVPRIATARFKPRPNRSMLLDAEQLWKGIQQKSLQVLDARNPQLFAKGHIPSAQNAFLRDNLKRRQGSNLARQNRAT